MSATVSKRQQAKNEKVLHSLVKDVPGNRSCADCGTPNPTWASWNLGVFLCIRCASLHRKLGTHISKVKSISMDSWSNDQIETMKKKGNTVVNKELGSDPSRSPMPQASEDADSQMERYIRKKYETRPDDEKLKTPTSASSSGFGASLSASPPSTSYSSKSERTRKTSKGFGGRRLSIGIFRSSSPSPNPNKVNQVLGATPYQDKAPPRGSISFPSTMVVLSPRERYASELQKLSEMGFKDVDQNIKVLEDYNGNVLQSVEVLLKRRGNEENKPPPPAKDNVSGFGASVQKAPASGAGISVQKTGKSNNPWDDLDKEEAPLPPLPTQQMNQQMMSQAPQMPQMTGYQGQQQNWGGQNGMQYGYLQQPQPNPFQMGSMTQSLPALSPQHTSSSNPYSQYSSNSGTPTTNGSFNPFMPPQNVPTPPLTTSPFGFPQQQQQLLSQPTGQPSQPFSAPSMMFTNPFQQQTTHEQQISPQQQSAQNPYQQQQFSLSPQHTSNPWATQNAQGPFSAPAAQNAFLPQQVQQQQAFPQQQQPPAQQLNPYMTGGRFNKSDILSLYNAPQLAPPPNPSPIPVAERQPTKPQSPQGPSAGSNNPFAPNGLVQTANNGGSTSPRPNGSRHLSQESVDFGAWQSGRHSPDAFASLAFSAR